MLYLLVQLVAFLITFFVTQKLDAQTCPANWFGENCMYKCMCLSNARCDNGGNCPANKCAPNFFGTGCQFYDKVSTSSLSLANYLKDHDKTTCNPDASATAIEVRLTDNLLFMWFRMEVKDERSMYNFSVLITSSTVCYNERRFFGTKWVDVTCANTDPTSLLKITGAIVPDICSIYISGGRNVALKQYTFVTPKRVWDAINESGEAVDGSAWMTYDPRSYVLTNQVDDPSFDLRYNRPQYILSMYVLGNDNAHIQHLRDFKLEMFGTNHSRLLSFTANSAPQNIYYYYTIGDIRSQAKTIKLTGASKSGDQRYLKMSEFISLGETPCPEGTYGLWCGEKCPCQFAEVCNPVLGMCAPPCKPGFFGRNCSFPCNGCLDGICSNILGRCQLCLPGKLGVTCDTDCTRGFYGQNCSTLCSKDCVGGICATTDGKCFSCPSGFKGDYCSDVCDSGYYGLNCSMLCGNSCKDSICQNVDGKCVQCYHGFEGDRCENECQAGFFGNKCASECPQNCEDVCDHVTGKCTCIAAFEGVNCSDCAAGLYGENCTEKCSITCSDKKCNRTTGECFSCIDKYTGNFCAACQDGFFGDKCASECPKNCKDVCDGLTGNCTCMADFVGVTCSDCVTGYYGETCTEKCSIKCSDQKCDSKTGECFSCIAEYKGKLCAEQLQQSTPIGHANWWMIFLLATGLTVAVCGTLLFCQKRSDYTNEER